MSDTPQFKEGEVYRIDELPDNQMNQSGKLEWVDDEQLALCTEDRQQVIVWFSHVEVKEVKYLTEDGKLLDAESDLRSDEAREAGSLSSERPNHE